MSQIQEAAAKAIFPHSQLQSGQEVNLHDQSGCVTCTVKDVTPLEGNKYIVLLFAPARGIIRLYWLQGHFHLDQPDGEKVEINF